MIEMTYCGEPYHDQLGYVVDCGAADGPCRRCLRTHITHLEAALVDAEACSAIFSESQQRALKERNEALDALEARP